MLKKITISLLFSLFLFGCFYDKNAELHPNGTPTACDTLNVTYSNQVLNIVNSTCIGCHYAGAIHGYDYSTWTDLNASALNGRLMGSLQYQSGHPPMPPSFQLSACQIKTFQIWVNAGAPQN